MRHVYRCVAALAVVTLLIGCSPSDNGQSREVEPTTTVTPAGGEVTITRTVFQIVYKLQGVSATSATVGLMSNRQLSFVPELPADSTVAPGQIVGAADVDPDVEAALEAGAATSSIDESRLGQLQSLKGPIVTPVGGVLELNGGVPVVRSPGIDVVVGLTPIQDLRYQSLQFTGRATIETVVGQREAACEAVWVQQSESESTDQLSELHCRLPDYIETAPGLRARVVLESQRFEDTVVVPNIYIGYDAATDGYFIRVLDNGHELTIPVVVGVTDGVVRVITSDVPVGATLVLPVEK